MSVTLRDTAIDDTGPSTTTLAVSSTTDAAGDPANNQDSVEITDAASLEGTSVSQPEASDQSDDQTDESEPAASASAATNTESGPPPPDTLPDVSNNLEYPQISINPESNPGDASNAHDLSSAQWQAVLHTNSLLCGFQIREANEDVVRARQNAFILKGSSPKKDVIPYFQVEDGSWIQVQETRNAFQRSLAHNSFSKKCIESNLSAGDFGIMAGLSGSRERSKEDDIKKQRILRDQEYYAVYNFPRARLLLDEEELELSDNCKAMLENIRQNPSIYELKRFFKLFGHVFVTSVLLGGQQKTTKYAAAFSHSTEEVQQDALRTAIGAKVNAQYVSASAQISSEKVQMGTQSDQQYTSLSSLGISSSGGNTLIGSDVSNWVRTVAPSKNWRVIENEIAESIHDLIGKFPGWDDVPSLFKDIINSAQSRKFTSLISFTMAGKPLCWDEKNRNLYCPKYAGNNLRKAIFRVASRG